MGDKCWICPNCGAREHYDGESAHFCMECGECMKLDAIKQNVGNPYYPASGMATIKKPGFWQMPKPVQVIIVIAIILLAYSIIHSITNNSGKTKEADNNVPSVAANAGTSSVTKASSCNKEIITSTIYSDTFGDLRAYTVYKVENTGETNLYIGNASMSYKDSSGYVTQVDDYVDGFPQVIAPGESAYYVDNSSYDGGAGNVTVSPDIKTATVDLIRFKTSNVRMTIDQYDRIKITGEVANSTNEDESLLYVSAVVFDKKGIPLATLFTIIDVPAGDTKAFEMTDNIIGSPFSNNDVDTCTTWAYPMQMQFD